MAKWSLRRTALIISSRRRVPFFRHLKQHCLKINLSPQHFLLTTFFGKFNLILMNKTVFSAFFSVLSPSFLLISFYVIIIILLPLIYDFIFTINFDINRFQAISLFLIFFLHKKGPKTS